jgi:hypothetical protein
LIPPESRDHIDIRKESVNLQPGKEVTLEVRDSIDASDLLSPFKKLYAIELAQVYERCDTIIHAMPRVEVKALGNAILEWTHQVAK